MTEGLRVLAPILIGYLLGSIPFGYVIVKMIRGIDIREYGSHNIGATNVLRVVGLVPALLTLLGDIGKGILPPVLATLPLFTGGGPPNPWIVVLAPLAAICGHAYSAYFYLKERKFARGKAVAAGLGAVIGFVLSGQVAWPALAVLTAVFATTLVLPKVAQGRWGWVSLASILSACSLPVIFALVRAPLPFVVFGFAAAIFVTWKHKENLGRLLDGVEPRLGEKVPLAGVDKDEVACAFLIHAMTPDDWWQSRRFSWAVGMYRVGLLPLGVLKRLFLYVKPLKSDTIHGIVSPDGRQVQVHLLAVPWLPEMIKDHPALAMRRAAQAAQMARDLGARCMGLGAYWSVVGNKGQEVQAAAPFIPITNGGAYTAGTVKQAVPTVLNHLRLRNKEPEQATAAVVGANGVVGFGICRQLAGRVARIVMVGTDVERLERSANLLRRRSPGMQVDTTTDIEACAHADMIFTATSTVAPILFARHVRAGTVVYDLGRPADVDVSVFEVAGVTVIPGGVVRPPGEMRHRLDVHFGTGQIPACMAETILTALDECYERVSLGNDTKSENIDYFVELAERHGFHVVDEVISPPGTAGAPVAVHVRGAVAPDLT